MEDNNNSIKIDINHTLDTIVSLLKNMGLSKEQIQVKLQILKNVVLNDLNEQDIEDYFGDAAVQIPEILRDDYEELYEFVEEYPQVGLPELQKYSVVVETN